MDKNRARNPQQAGYSPQPVAYDKDGNPLYSQPQFVHYSRAIEPLQQQIPPEVQALHDDSQRKYPNLNLSRGEYVLSAVRRHPIGLFKIWAIGLGLIVTFFVIYYLSFASPGASDDLRAFAGIAVAVLGIMLMLIIGGTLVATYVYTANRFYLTNESVIQEIQESLFTKNEQTVSLINIEDASYKQAGIVPVLFNYGMIRLSTEGDETTYRFSYVSNPKREIAILNDAVESFKNGRPVGAPPDPTDD
jgi:hypothetical protein